MITVDSHCHTRFSKDCDFPPEDMLAAAEKRGLAALAFTDHAEVNNFDENTRRRIAAAADYIPRLNQSFGTYRTDTNASAFSPVELRIIHGIEIAQQHVNPALSAEIIGAGGYDFVLGSLHAVKSAERLPRNKEYTWAEPEPGDLYFVDYSQLSPEQIYSLVEEYLDTALEIVSSADFDSFAHLGYIVRYIFRADGTRYELSKHEKKLKSVLQSLIDRGKSLEINTADIGGGYDRLVPDVSVIKMYRGLGGRYVTAGSDAHIAERVGAGLDRACAVLKENGFGEIGYYVKRERIAAAI